MAAMSVVSKVSKKVVEMDYGKDAKMADEKGERSAV